MDVLVSNFNFFTTFSLLLGAVLPLMPAKNKAKPKSALL